VLVPCIESNIKIVFEQAMSTVDLKWEHNYIQNRRKTGVLAEEASDLMKRFLLLKGDDI
jgi:hypothetical protein